MILPQSPRRNAEESLNRGETTCHCESRPWRDETIPVPVKAEKVVTRKDAKLAKKARDRRSLYIDPGKEPESMLKSQRREKSNLKTDELVKIEAIIVGFEKEIQYISAVILPLHTTPYTFISSKNGYIFTVGKEPSLNISTGGSRPLVLKGVLKEAYW
jgi:hypothetical protein